MRIAAQVLLTFLLNALWQVTLIVACAMICDWLLRGLTSRYRHFLWVVTLFVSLAVPVASGIRFTSATLARENPETEESVRPVVTTRFLTPGVEIARQSERSDAALADSPITSSISVNARLAMLLTALYALLIVWRTVRLWRAWHRTRAILRSAFTCDFSDSFQTIIDSCQNVIGTRPFSILCSAEVPVPITIGVFKRIIILPQRFMREANQDVLRSAIGHELVHIARRDYLTNLVCEYLYLPLSFHPAAALARRRIKHTRELCCDETVAARLIKPDVYARSLISLIGSAPLWRPLAPDTTIGINESDILEVRIMTLLKTTDFSPRRRTLLLIAASLLLAMPCVAAARFALSFDTGKHEPANAIQLPQKRESWERQEDERAIVDLQRRASALREQIKQAPESQRPEIEARLSEVERNLASQKRLLEQFGETKERTAFAKVSSEYPGDEAAMRAAKEKLEAEQRLAGDRKPRLIYHIEPVYPADAREKKIEGAVVLGFTVNHDGLPESITVKKSLYPSLDKAAVDAVSQWRFEPAMKNGEIVSTWLEVEVNFNLNSGEVQRGEAVSRGGRTEFQGQNYKMQMPSEAQLRAERQEEERTQLELARQAKISMDQAIQIATSKTPGKVTECSLVAERWSSPGELAKGAMVLYHVVILSGDEDNPVTMHVLVNAADGSIVKAGKEERKTENQELSFNRSPEREPLNGGVLNIKATSLPLPEYPVIARQAHASGSVNVEVLIDEGGKVVAAHSISGHPLLQAAAVNAAREATFTPTRLNGEPVKVRGIITYNFVAQ